ncbi:hypothetical protein L8648_000623 [Campylobacter lari]|nr:hypothetical protein [Campylobacter lari]EII0700222.1 hypothetical protein [Campylobacter lari]EIV5071353.1 hypothetical protein [Campylobacter lari]
MDKIIVASRKDALGERMLAFLNAMYLSEKFELKFYFLWHVIRSTTDEKVSFPNIQNKEYFFTSEFIEKHYFNYDIQYPNYSIWWNNPKMIIENIKNNKYCVSLQTSLFDFQGNFILHGVDGVDDLDYKNVIQKKWREIGFTDHIKTAIGCADKVKLLGDYVVFHIRSADIIKQKNGIDMYLCYNKGLTVFIVMQLILECLKNQKLIIIGDDFNLNYEIKKYCTKATKSQNIYISEDLIDDGFDSTQRMFFDITLMANSKKLYLSGSSGFSNLSYLIGNCERICVYDMYSLQEKYNIIKSNLQKFDFNNHQKSFAFIHLYIYAKELNMPISEQIDNIKEAMRVRDDAFVFKVFYVDLLLKNGQPDVAEEFFVANINNMDKFFENLLYNGWGTPEYFLYDFVFLSYLNIKNIAKYPNLYCVTYYLVYKLITTNNKKFKDKIDFFLRYNYFDKKVLSSCLFLNNHEKIILLLENEIIKSIDRYAIQSESAKKYIYDHLAYKLGLAYNIYSKGLFNKLMLPIILIYISKEHKRIKMMRRKKILENLELGVPCLKNYPDYNESLTEKDSYNYKLGEIIISAHKNWYKGGYIKMMFDIYKLKNKMKLRGEE